MIISFVILHKNVLVCVCGHFGAGGILVVLPGACFWMKNRMNTELSTQKEQLESQRDQLQEQRDQLIELSRQLEEATHAKLSFFTSVSHDFRTPLTLIADPINQLLEKKTLVGRDRDMLEIVHRNVSILLRLITQILDFQKYECGKLNLHLSEFNVFEGVKEWTKAFHVLAARKHIHFKVVAEGNVADYGMVADAERWSALFIICYPMRLSLHRKRRDKGGIVSEKAGFTKPFVLEGQ